jgi:hypothetical protein
MEIEDEDVNMGFEMWDDDVAIRRDFGEGTRGGPSTKRTRLE